MKNLAKYKYIYYLFVGVFFTSCTYDCPDLTIESAKFGLVLNSENNKEIKFIDKYGDTSSLKANYGEYYSQGGLMKNGCHHSKDYQLKGYLKNNKDSSITCNGYVQFTHRIVDDNSFINFCTSNKSDVFFVDSKNNKFQKITYEPSDSVYIIIQENKGISKINLISNSYTRIFD